MSDNKQFRGRPFVSVLVALSALIISVSGIILYIAPKGRVAHATNWTLFFLDKDGWGAIHTIFSYVFLVVAIIHLVFNWKVFVSYLKDKVTKALSFRKEWVVGFIVTVLIAVLTVFKVPPFQTIMDLGEAAKDAWETTLMQDADFLPHSEEFTIDEFAKRYDVTLDLIHARLQKEGIVWDKSANTLGDLAVANNKTPLELYRIMIEKTGASVTPESDEDHTQQEGGTGYGMMTVADVARDIGITDEEAKERLTVKGVTNARVKQTLRDIGDANGLRPVDVYSIIKGE